MVTINTVKNSKKTRKKIKTNANKDKTTTTSE